MAPDKDRTRPQRVAVKSRHLRRCAPMLRQLGRRQRKPVPAAIGWGAVSNVRHLNRRDVSGLLSEACHLLEIAQDLLLQCLQTSSLQSAKRSGLQTNYDDIPSF